MTDDSYYNILGVDRSANATTIRKAYLKLSLKHHPDKNTDNPEAAKARFIRIGEAYEVLSDPVQRDAYDAELRSGGFRSSSQQQHSSSQQHQQQYYGGASQQSQQARQDASYDSYRAAFDATMAGLSEEEVQGVMGAAAMLGSVVGSILGAKMMKNSNSQTLRGIGSMVGSMVASEAASSMVQSAHVQSKERVLMDQERRARGEAPSPSVSGKQAWKDLVKSAAGNVKEKAAAALVAKLLAKGTKSANM